MGQFAALRKQKIEGFEELKEVVPGTLREIVQLEGGRIKGEISHAMIASESDYSPPAPATSCARPMIPVPATF